MLIFGDGSGAGVQGQAFYSGTKVGSGSLCVHRFCYFWSDPLLSSGGRGTPHMKGVGMLVGNFELNP